MSVSPDVKMCTSFFARLSNIHCYDPAQLNSTGIAATLLNSADIGAINLTALVTPLSKTGFHQTIEQRLRQIQIQFKQCSTTLLASKQKMTTLPLREYSET